MRGNYVLWNVEASCGTDVIGEGLISTSGPSAHQITLITGRRLVLPLGNESLWSLQLERPHKNFVANVLSRLSAVVGQVGPKMLTLLQS